jgi:hypothetical protein
MNPLLLWTTATPANNDPTANMSNIDAQRKLFIENLLSYKDEEVLYLLSLENTVELAILNEMVTDKNLKDLIQQAIAKQ